MKEPNAECERPQCSEPGGEGDGSGSSGAVAVTSSGGSSSGGGSTDTEKPVEETEVDDAAVAAFCKVDSECN